MVDYKQLARNTMWVYVISFLIMPIGFLIRMMYARQLSVADYGLFYGLFAFFGVFAFLTDFGIISSTYFFLAKYIAHNDASKIKTLYFINQGLQLSLSIVIGIILYLLKGPIITHFYHNAPHISFMFDLFIIWWIFQPFKAGNIALFTYSQEQKISKSLELLELASVLVFSFLGFFYFQNYMVPIYAYLAGMIFITIISTILVYHIHKKYFHARLYLKKDLFSELGHYTLMYLPTTILSIIIVQMDILIIQYFLGAEQVAYYSSGFGIAMMMSAFTIPITLILYPLLMNLWHSGKKEEISKIMNLFLNNIALFILPFCLFIFAFSDQIIIALLTDKFLPASIILKILVIIFILRVYYGLFYNMLPSFGEPKKTSIILTFSFLIGLFLDIFFAIKYGIIGVAIANGIFTILVLTLFYREVAKLITIKIDYLNNLKIMISSLIFIIICFLLRNRINIFITNIPKLNFVISGGIIFMIALIAYAISLLLLGVINKDKINLFKELFLSRFNLTR